MARYEPDRRRRAARWLGRRVIAATVIALALAGLAVVLVRTMLAD